jgi:hypothetical protein
VRVVTTDAILERGLDGRRLSVVRRDLVQRLGVKVDQSDRHLMPATAELQQVVSATGVG